MAETKSLAEDKAQVVTADCAGEDDAGRGAGEAGRQDRASASGRISMSWPRRPAFHELMREEFPRQAGAGEWVDAVSRRGFLKVMGASLALAGLAGCTKQPDEPIFPYVKQPEDLILGKPMYFATAYPFPTGAIPVLVKSDSFRPIKVDGNPEHPMSKGKSDAFTQATLLDLYDPDRSQHVLSRGENSSWGEFQEAFAAGGEEDAAAGRGSTS